MRLTIDSGKLRGVISALTVLLVSLVTGCGLYGPVAGDALIDPSVTEATWAQAPTDLTPDPQSVYRRLANGFRYVLLPNGYPQDRVSLHLVVQAGSLHESEDQRGLAHYLEHMLFCGSTHFPPGELVKFFQRIGMQFGPDANAHTGFFETVYDINLPRGDRQSLRDALVVFQDYAQGALLLPAEIDRERQVILAEKRARDSVGYRTFVDTLRFELPGTRLASRLPIGVAEVIEAAGRPELKAYYDTWYRPERLILVAVGDFEVAAAEALIREAFSALTARAPPQPVPSVGHFDHDGKRFFYHHEREAGNTQVTLEVIRRQAPETDSLAKRRERLLAEMAAQILQHRLDEQMRRPNAPFTEASIGSGVFLQEIAYASISAETEPAYWEPTLASLEQTLRQGLRFGFSPEEVTRVQREFLAELDRRVKTRPTLESRRLARKIIRHLNSDEVFLSPEQERQLLAPVIAEATAQDLLTALRANWDEDHRLILVSGNADLTDQPVSAPAQIAAAYDRSRAVAVRRPRGPLPCQFPYLPVPEVAGTIVDRQNIEDLGIVQVDWANGVRLNVKSTDFEAGQVRVAVDFGPGRSGEPADSPGLADLAAAVINESALGSLSRSRLETCLAGKNVEAYFHTGEDAFTLRGMATTDELELLVQLLYAYYRDPGYRQEAFDLVMQRYAQQYRALERSVDGAMRLRVLRFLAGGDSRFGLPPYTEFRQLRLAQVRHWIDAALGHLPLEISVVGDVEVEPVIRLVSRYFGTLGLSVRDPDNRGGTGAPQFPAGGALTVEVETRIPKGMVVVAYPTDDLWPIQRTRRVAVLADVFAERLRKRIREKLGASYSPYAYNRPSRAYADYGVLLAVVTVDPAQAPMVVQEVKKISADLAAEGITAEELQRSLDPTLTSIKDMLRENTYWLNTVLSDSLQHPEQLDWSRSIQKDYASIDVEDINRLAARFLKNRFAAQVIVRPVQAQGDKATGARPAAGHNASQTSAGR